MTPIITDFVAEEVVSAIYPCARWRAREYEFLQPEAAPNRLAEGVLNYPMGPV